MSETHDAPLLPERIGDFFSDFEKWEKTHQGDGPASMPTYPPLAYASWFSAVHGMLNESKAPDFTMSGTAVPHFTTEDVGGAPKSDRVEHLDAAMWTQFRKLCAKHDGALDISEDVTPYGSPKRLSRTPWRRGSDDNMFRIASEVMFDFDVASIAAKDRQFVTLTVASALSVMHLFHASYRRMAVGVAAALEGGAPSRRVHTMRQKWAEYCLRACVKYTAHHVHELLKTYNQIIHAVESDEGDSGTDGSFTHHDPSLAARCTGVIERTVMTIGEAMYGVGITGSAYSGDGAQYDGNAVGDKWETLLPLASARFYNAFLSSEGVLRDWIDVDIFHTMVHAQTVFWTVVSQVMGEFSTLFMDPSGESGGGEGALRAVASMEKCAMLVAWSMGCCDDDGEETRHLAHIINRHRGGGGDGGLGSWLQRSFDYEATRRAAESFIEFLDTHTPGSVEMNIDARPVQYPDSGPGAMLDGTGRSSTKSLSSKTANGGYGASGSFSRAVIFLVLALEYVYAQYEGAGTSHGGDDVLAVHLYNVRKRIERDGRIIAACERIVTHASHIVDSASVRDYWRNVHGSTAGTVDSIFPLYEHIVPSLWNWGDGVAGDNVPIRSVLCVVPYHIVNIHRLDPGTAAMAIKAIAIMYDDTLQSVGSHIDSQIVGGTTWESDYGTAGRVASGHYTTRVGGRDFNFMLWAPRMSVRQVRCDGVSDPLSMVARSVNAVIAHGCASGSGGRGGSCEDGGSDTSGVNVGSIVGNAIKHQFSNILQLDGDIKVGIDDDDESTMYPHRRVDRFQRGTVAHKYANVKGGDGGDNGDVSFVPTSLERHIVCSGEIKCPLHMEPSVSVAILHPSFYGSDMNYRDIVADMRSHIAVHGSWLNWYSVLRKCHVGGGGGGGGNVGDSKWARDVWWPSDPDRALVIAHMFVWQFDPIVPPVLRRYLQGDGGVGSAVPRVVAAKTRVSGTIESMIGDQMAEIMGYAQQATMVATSVYVPVGTFATAVKSCETLFGSDSDTIGLVDGSPQFRHRQHRHGRGGLSPSGIDEFTRQVMAIATGSPLHDRGGAKDGFDIMGAQYIPSYNMAQVINHVVPLFVGILCAIAIMGVGKHRQQDGGAIRLSVVWNRIVGPSVHVMATHVAHLLVRRARNRMYAESLNTYFSSLHSQSGAVLLGDGSNGGGNVDKEEEESAVVMGAIVDIFSGHCRDAFNRTARFISRVSSGHR